MNRRVFRATVRWPFDVAQDERTGGWEWVGGLAENRGVFSEPFVGPSTGLRMSGLEGWGVVWRDCHERWWGFNATVAWSLDGAQDERTGGLGGGLAGLPRTEVFSATVRWPFVGAQDERTGGLRGLGWAGSLDPLLRLGLQRGLGRHCDGFSGRAVGVFSATVRWPFVGAQDERTGGWGWFGGLATNRGVFRTLSQNLASNPIRRSGEGRNQGPRLAIGGISTNLVSFKVIT